ncbi:MAG TPA: AMP-binding protein, partial [Pyrinomonadaceae bacterium]|nr:AMP-binding protein [Pyrinomonadaceae bacterium]
MNARANQLARHLRTLGVGPETLVALYLERGVEMIVGLLGVLKAGGAYVPLDAAYPKQRLSFVLDDARIRVVLTQQGLAESLPERSALVVRLDADWTSISAQSTQNVESEASSENLAYVIYTSGSTGRPKGVLVKHRSVVNLAAALRQAVYRHHPAPLRVSLNAPLAFDASVKQIVQLLDGHTLHVLPDLVRTDAALLSAYTKAQQLDVLDCTPAHLRQLLQEDGGAGQMM